MLILSQTKGDGGNDKLEKVHWLLVNVHPPSIPQPHKTHYHVICYMLYRVHVICYFFCSTTMPLVSANHVWNKVKDFLLFCFFLILGQWGSWFEVVKTCGSALLCERFKLGPFRS